MMDIIQANFTPGKVERIIGERPSEEFFNKKFGRYDAAVEEGLNTTTQKQMQFAQLLQMREAGIPVPDETLLEAATIQNKKQLVEQIRMQQEASQQQAQKQAEAELAQAMAQTKLTQARAIADQGLGLERISRVQENESLATEREAKAEHEHTEAILTMIKASKELEGMDIAHVKELVTMWQQLKQQQMAETQMQREESRQNQQDLTDKVTNSAGPAQAQGMGQSVSA